MGKTYLFNYEDGTPKSLYDLLSLVTGLLQDSYQEIIRLLQTLMNLLSRDYRILSRDHKTPMNFL